MYMYTYIYSWPKLWKDMRILTILNSSSTSRFPSYVATYIYIHTYIHTYIKPAFSERRIHTTAIHTYIHTYKHTYIDSHMVFKVAWMHSSWTTGVAGG